MTWACFWPDGEPRIHAMITHISTLFDCRSKVEITLQINNRSEVHGEIRMIVKASEAQHYKIGDVYAAHFKRVSP